MAATETASAEEILAVPKEWPERLFSAAATVDTEWRGLAKRWHPDRNPRDPQAGPVFRHLCDLHREAERRIGGGVWRTPGMVRFESLDGRVFSMRYRRCRSMAIGDLYAGRTNIVFAVERDHADLFENARRTLTALRYADGAMEAEFSRNVPRVVESFETADRLVMAVTVSADLVLLDDLAAHFEGALEPRAAAWIVSGLSNIACWLAWSGLAHGAICPDTVMVSPRHHSVVLAGGWFHSVPFGAALLPSPEFAVRHGRAAVGHDKKATPRLDLELVRAVGRAALGDPDGSRLLTDPAVPRPMAEWLVLPPADDAFEDYRSWERAREASFGARRFVEMDVDVDALIRQREEI
ncbi:hypothetical protein BHAOGJBA_4502 [Methylobacterium hispanicum]|uniref:J domain-containing protein n=1 Tax=Methylobacterium hispanicum TaxID=270350 RepID=A0AAV4ZS89_9HYPH|nr:J domain-containing protein [Methylobacterium hispanicum]GJD90958.1 hypothetical protein BHAOGJBA_4502 [Methylobacterium hispanicum]